jgi:hypothetical protein
MRLEINQTYARIGVERTPRRLEIETQRARLEFRQKHAKVNMDIELPRVEIDQSECFASAGLKGPVELTREAARRGHTQVIEYIGKTAADGRMLAAIERGGNPLKDIVVRDAYPQKLFNIDYIPKARPRITVTGGVQYDPERNSEGVNNGVEGTFVPGRIDIRVEPSRVRIYMEQYNSISISYKGKYVDGYR